MFSYENFNPPTKPVYDGIVGLHTIKIDENLALFYYDHHRNS